MEWLFKAIGVVGLLLITIGILVEDRRRSAIVQMVGGACLFAYSVSIRDWIFIVLQVIFTVAAVYKFMSSPSRAR